MASAATSLAARVQDAAAQLSTSILRHWLDQLTAVVYDVSFDRSIYSNPQPCDTARPPPATVWLSCDLAADGMDAAHLQRACECLALLQILGELDPDLWKAVAGSIWPILKRRLKSPPALGDVRTNPPLLGFLVWVRNVEHVEWVSERVVGVESSSSEYREAVDAVETMLRGSHSDDQARRLRSGTTPRIPVLVQYKTRDVRVSNHHRVLRQLLQAVVIQQRQFRSSIPSGGQADLVHPLDVVDARTCFDIVSVGIDGSGMESVDLQGLEYLQRIADQGVRVLNIPFLDLDWESKTGTTTMLQALFPPATSSRARCVGVREITISDASSHAMTVPMLTALQVCHSLDTVTIEMSDPRPSDRFERAERDHLWRWIAYALLSRDACHSIKDLVIDAKSLRAADVAQIQKVLAMDNPLELLVAKSLCCHQNYISASRFHFVAQRNENALDFRTSRHELTTSTPLVVRVIQCPSETNNQHWIVLLPGRGLARVHVDDGVAMIAPETSPKRSLPCFSSIQFFDMNEENKGFCLDLIQALPPSSVEAVEFVNDDEYLEVDEWYPEVLAACPGLKRFRSPPSSGIGGLEAFIQRAADDTCVLEVLIVGSCVGLRDQGLVEFLEALSDQRHPLAIHLRELELNVMMDEGHDTEAVGEFMEAVQTMLDQNRRLHTILFVLECISDISEFVWDDEEVAIATAPLALCSKLALLSAVAGSTRLASAPLDSSVLTIVFQFAAEHRMRQVDTSSS